MKAFGLHRRQQEAPLPRSTWGAHQILHGLRFEGRIS